jgi:protein-disulfide isomerase
MGVCDVCNKELASREGYLLTTEQVVSTPAYWESYLAKVAAMGGTRDAKTKEMAAKQMAAQTEPWMVCDACIGKFSVDKSLAKEYATKWYDTDGKFAPPGSGSVPVSKVNMGDAAEAAKAAAAGGAAEAPKAAAAGGAASAPKETSSGADAGAPSSSSFLKYAVIVVLGVGAVVGGYFLGRGNWSIGGAVGKFTCPTPGAAVAGDDVERKCVPFEGKAKGSGKAQVTIVEFSDFQCPYCSRVLPTLDKLIKEYPDKVRVFFRHNPLPFHSDAGPAAQAAVAAELQGKFWPMHDILFKNQQNLKRADLEKYAAEIGLDVAKFKQDIDSPATKKRVDEDLDLAKKLTVQGTPNFFINGRPLRGAVPYEQFKTVVDDELLRGKKLMEKGTSAGKVFTALMKGEGKGLGQAQPPAPPPRIPIGSEVYKIEPGDAPHAGGQEPKITLIEFSDFQCPYCSRAKGTVDELLKIYKNDIQVTFRHFPLPFHSNAMPAAIAAVAAAEQGKFWPMHDKLFANQQALSPADLEKYATEIGLDVAKFKAAIENPKTKAAVEADTKMGNTFGVGGTPSFFLNGRAFSGAYPLDSFKNAIDEEIKKVDAKLAAGTPRAGLYKELIKDGLEKATPKKEEPRAGEPAPGDVYKADIKGAPIKGAKDALVTIVQFSDFQCPFCSRVEPTIDQVMKEFAGKVRVAWRNLPLPFHNNAKPAALAAVAAQQQGKFWEMHEILFKNQQALAAADLEKYAQQIGLNMAKYKAAIEDKKLAEAVDADAALGNKIGARGTPAFFINGRFLSGAQPFERFKSLIEEELKKAEELAKKVGGKAKVYDALMRTAKTEVGGGAPPAAANAPAPGPAKKVDVGNAPVRGPKTAPITVVLFSDFQCPFCGRVEPAIAELEKAYPGKVRVAWKNFPLSFHNNAKPAAEAALAAHEQGKFWQMHDILFKNQQALSAADLEKYAKEIGLDVAKFKSAMESHKFAAQVDADTKQGTDLGVSGTPASFINGQMLSGAVPFDEFKKIVDAELAKGSKGKSKG